MFGSKLIKSKNLNTPYYLYNLDLLERTLLAIKRNTVKCGFKMHYALKANVNIPILKKIKKYGFGTDCVSGNEIKIAKKIGFKISDIVFAGVGKSDYEIKYALKNNIFCFNSESIEEIKIINFFAKKLKKTANIALRINPDVDANTHSFLTTGTQENKFGINLSDFDNTVRKIKKFSNIKIIGLHFHIGSQITDFRIYKKLCFKINHIVKMFSKKNFKIEHINVGGGLGIDYKNPENNSIPDFDKYFSIFKNNLNIKNKTIHFELGRSVVGQCGNLLTKVLFIKNGGLKKFVVVDAGMTELIRPALYNSYHKIQNLTSSEKMLIKYDVVGPVCETSDFFAKNIELPKTKRGDILIVRSAGAYGQVMSSEYNLRKPVKAYYSKNFAFDNV